MDTYSNISGCDYMIKLAVEIAVVACVCCIA